VVVQVVAPIAVNVQMSLDGSTLWGDMQKHGDVYWRDLASQSELWIRLADGRMLETPWEKVDVSTPGLVELYRAVNGPLVSFSDEGLSPTLRAFAYSVDLDLCAAPKPPKEEPEVVHENPSEVPDQSMQPVPPVEPAPVVAKRPVEQRLDTQGRPLFKMVLRDGKAASVADSERVSAADISDGLIARTYIRGVSRYRKGRRGSASMGPNGNYWFEPLVLAGRWNTIDTGGVSLLGLLQTGALQPKVENVLVARAVGPAGEGLPWVCGVIVEYQSDAVAQQVREICARLESPPIIVPGENYAGRLAAVEAAPTEQGMRELIGDENYDAFDTDTQRLWFAQNGAWYDTHYTVHSDDQGYIAVQDPPLEAGRCYVLYLWSNGRDDLHPNARFAFKVDEHGVADLGAIHMPTYTD
jgi:hypothetical protein